MLRTKLADKDPTENTYVTFAVTVSDKDVVVDTEYLSGNPAAKTEIFVEGGTLWVRTTRHHDEKVVVHRVASLY